MDTPYLSVVVTTRNDDHGGNLKKRTRLFLNGFIEQADRYKLSSEIVLVEWNPPANRPRLSEILDLSFEACSCRLRIIEVPSSIHNQFKYSDRLPLFQMIAKNAGIRRSRGRFILVTNVDILFSNELIRFLAARQLDSGCMYRAERYDVPADVPLNETIDHQLDYCRKNILRIYCEHGARSLRPGASVPAQRLKINFVEKLKRLLNFLQRKKPSIPNKQLPLHIHACGDFTLMSRKNWSKVRGYPEFAMYSLNLDTLLCYAANYSGAREFILKYPMMIFHIDHSKGSGWLPGEGEKLMYKRLTEAGIPWLDWEKCVRYLKEMSIKARPIIFNQEAWGLAHENLTEQVIFVGSAKH